MAESIIEVESNLRLDQYTFQELKTWMQLKKTSRRDYFLGTTGGAFVGWFASWKLKFASRFFIAAGAALGCGNWALNRGLKSHLDTILSLHGTRLQEELSASMLRRYHDHPKYKELFWKHFYPENVYDDSSDIPKLRWRCRSIFDDSSGDRNSSTNNQKGTVKKETTLGSKPAQINTAAELMENPIDWIFGTPTRNEENQSSGGSNVPRTGRSNTTPKRHIHRSKRHHHRRHRKHHHEDSEP